MKNELERKAEELRKEKKAVMLKEQRIMEGKSKLKLRHIYLFFRFKKIYPDLFNYIITLINMKTKYLNFFLLT